MGEGIYRDVYRVGKFALKVERGGDKKIRNLRGRALKLRLMNIDLRRKLDFLPKFHGVVVTAVESRGKIVPAVVTFHEYIRPGPLYSVKSFVAALKLVDKAGKKGLFLDIKPSNFGEKRGKVYYLDETGIGKGPIPPDVVEDLARMFGKLKKVGSLGQRRKLPHD